MSMAHQVVELVSFELEAGTDEADFLKGNEGVQAFVRGLEGFVYRSLCKNEESGQWVDIVYWADADAAKQASDAFMNSPACVAWASMIDRETLSMQHVAIKFAEMAEMAAEPEATTA